MVGHHCLDYLEIIIMEGKEMLDKGMKFGASSFSQMFPVIP